MFGQGKLSAVENLKEPRIHALPHQTMLVTTATGDPAKTSGAAISKLFKAYFRIRGAVGAPRAVAPRARWPTPFDAPRESWVGHFGLPLPAGAQRTISERGGIGFPDVTIETWDYGEVAEVLHVGPYEDEATTVARLQGFLDAQGYHIVGPHEEEYVKGPGMIFRGDPKKYLTVLRYQVTKKR